MPEELRNILDRMETGFSHVIKNCSLLSLWPKVVDERVQKHTEPIKIRNRTLYVSTSSPAWAQELGFLKKNIMEKFNGLAGEEAICDIRFRAAG
jgi:predicted nucleic acid-binding Zn ribbon protein